MKFVILAACMLALANSQVTFTAYGAATCTTPLANQSFPLNTCSGSSKWYCVSGTVWTVSYTDTACTTKDTAALIPSTCMASGSAFAMVTCTGSTTGVTVASLTGGSIVTMMQYSDSGCTSLTATGYGFSTSNFTGSPTGVSPCATTACTQCPNANACSGYYTVACTGGSSAGNALVVASGFLLAQIVALLW